MKKYIAELIGTFWLVMGGCGSAVLAAAFPQLGIGFAGVSLAFGLTVLTMAFALGHISGCHLNPAVSVGLWAARRFPASELVPYIVAQVLGAIVAGGVLFVIASGSPNFDVAAGFASNGYGEHSPGNYNLLSALVSELVMTTMFVIVVLGATDPRAPQGFAPIAIGLALTLTLIHLISIPVTNPSRSIRHSSSAAGGCRSCGCSGSRPCPAQARRAGCTGWSAGNAACRPAARDRQAPARWRNRGYLKGMAGPVRYRPTPACAAADSQARQTE